MTSPAPISDLDAALAARAPLLGPAHRGAWRLFNGHLEGDARYVIDVYGQTAVVYHQAAAADAAAALSQVVDRLRSSLPWLGAVVVKERRGTTDEDRRGRVSAGLTGLADLDASVEEHGVRYAIDLRLNQDAGLYLDTRLLRRWLLDHSARASVLNTFAYTGSLGVAARAGGAARVVHTDLNRRFLRLAETSYALNGFDVDRRDFVAADFWSFVRGRKLQGARFDLVILDPPFYSDTRGGTIDLNRGTARLVNKVRPLVRSGGAIVVVNNSLFVSGAAFLLELDALCVGGWLAIERTIDVPDDVRGFAATRRGDPVVDPAPFTHSTKIVVLRVRHREGGDAVAD